MRRIRKLQDPDCIFCKIVKGEIPSYKIYEDEHALAFLDINPINEGHTLVIPKNHYETLDEAVADEIPALFSAVHKVTKGVIEGMNPEGYNIFTSAGEVAGQVVKHLHIHILPRWSGDKFRFIWPQQKLSEEKMTEIKEKISSAI